MTEKGSAIGTDTPSDTGTGTPEFCGVHPTRANTLDGAMAGVTVLCPVRTSPFSTGFVAIAATVPVSPGSTPGACVTTGMQQE